MKKQLLTIALCLGVMTQNIQCTSFETVENIGIKMGLSSVGLILLTAGGLGLKTSIKNIKGTIVSYKQGHIKNIKELCHNLDMDSIIGIGSGSLLCAGALCLNELSNTIQLSSFSTETRLTNGGIALVGGLGLSSLGISGLKIWARKSPKYPEANDQKHFEKERPKQIAKILYSLALGLGLGISGTILIASAIKDTQTIK